MVWIICSSRQLYTYVGIMIKFCTITRVIALPSVKSVETDVFETRNLGGARRVASQPVAKITIDPEPCDRSLGDCCLCPVADPGLFCCIRMNYPLQPLRVTLAKCRMAGTGKRIHGGKLNTYSAQCAFGKSDFDSSPSSLSGVLTVRIDMWERYNARGRATPSQVCERLSANL